MAIPAWFDAKAYFNNKLSQMNESVEAGGFDGTPGKVDSLALKAAFEAAGYTTDAEGLYQHFLDYGNAEGISPSALFDTQEYLYNKAADYYGTTAATPQMAEAMAQAMANVGQSAWDHFDMFWAEDYAKAAPSITPPPALTWRSTCRTSWLRFRPLNLTPAGPWMPWLKRCRMLA